jgi:hypothetical protein
MLPGLHDAPVCRIASAMRHEKNAKAFFDYSRARKDYALTWCCSNTNSGIIPIQIITISTYFSYSEIYRDRHYRT